MPSLVWALLFLVVGVVMYAVPGLVGQLVAPERRLTIARYYWRQAMRCYERLAMVRREIGGWTLLPISIDDERRLAQVTLDSGMLSDDVDLPFRDPAGCRHRLMSKPVTMVPGQLPAVVDPWLSEVGHWVSEAARDGELLDDGELQPEIEAEEDGLRLTDPLEALSLRTKSVEPEHVETVRKLTKRRFEQYGDSGPSAAQMGVVVGFAIGAGAIATLQYVQQNLIDGGSDTPTAPGVNVTDLPASIGPAMADAGTHFAGVVPA